jgi:small subunit ribosomal protein S19
MPYISQTLSKAIKKTSITNGLDKKKHSLIKVFSRSSTITPDLIGLQVQIHNGRGFAGLKITPNIIGYKFGSFAVTKRTARYRKQKK